MNSPSRATAPTCHEPPIDRRGPLSSSNSEANMPIDTLLSRLDKPRQTGPGRWIARCPAHADKSPSLSVRELDDGRILVHCFTGCPVNDVLAAVGLEFTNLFPLDSHAIGHANPERRPFPAADVLRALYHETLIVAAAAGFLLEGRPFSDEDRNRLGMALERIQAAVAYSGVDRHG